jgi:NDP-sugar pyrophosphorylase family protein
MLSIVIPMAGRGQRFADAGFAVPKPLVPVRGVPMIKAVIDNIRPQMAHRFVFLCLREHLERHRLAEHLRQWAPGCSVLALDAVTQGAACTILAAQHELALDEPMMIANCDQWVDADIDDYLGELDRQDADGLIMTMWADHPKWSYVRLDAAGVALEVVEKQVVSNDATVGIYNFRRAGDFIWAAQQMIAKELRVNGEFYTAPCFNQLIARGQKIVAYNVGAELDGMYGLGVPSDLELFERLPVAEQVLQGA